MNNITEEQVDDFFDSIIDPKSLNKKEYLEWLTRRSERGDGVSQYYLAFVYTAGIGTKQDNKKAFKLLKQSVKQNHKTIHEAQYDLACNYYCGRGTKKNIKKYYYWLKQSAKNGYYVAQTSLGEVYEKGEYTKKNIPKAIYWYKKAAKQGCFRSKSNLTRLDRYA